MSIAVVTDSASALPADIAQRHHVTVVPLSVVVGGQSHDEGVDVSPDDVTQRLRAGSPVGTSRPSPVRFDDVYAALARRGVDGVVSVHLSDAISGTYDAATVAARRAPLPVRVVDSRSVGMAVGFAALAGERAAADGDDLDAVVEAVTASVSRSRTYLCVDDLTHLRRGGRIRKTTAVVGSALAIKPLLRVNDGLIEPFERVRTSARALTRLADLAVAAAEELGGEVEISVQHVDARDRAEKLTGQLSDRVDRARQIWLVELGAAVGAHVGPGSIGVSVNPR